MCFSGVSLYNAMTSLHSPLWDCPYFTLERISKLAQFTSYPLLLRVRTGEGGGLVDFDKLKVVLKPNGYSTTRISRIFCILSDGAFIDHYSKQKLEGFPFPSMLRPRVADCFNTTPAHNDRVCWQAGALQLSYTLDSLVPRAPHFEHANVVSHMLSLGLGQFRMDLFKPPLGWVNNLSRPLALFLTSHVHCHSLVALCECLLCAHMILSLAGPWFHLSVGHTFDFKITATLFLNSVAFSAGAVLSLQAPAFMRSPQVETCLFYPLEGFR
ncbi:unnamed protein product [Protopolystoma xenopodis]|uniref:Uncharacterized protein n=1 Tax=Protopolystoma xenopodis TaxID=117903 RepID=A0A448XB14_9PLAT|nr:unnamed protein product [Protopolystoma xenopodis]